LKAKNRSEEENHDDSSIESETDKGSPSMMNIRQNFLRNYQKNAKEEKKKGISQHFLSLYSNGTPQAFIADSNSLSATQ
jgi:hypothetical protein